MGELKWVQLSTLALGARFCTRDGRVGCVMHRRTDTRPELVPVALLGEPYTHPLDGGLDVLPFVAPDLADDLAELAALRGWVEDERGLAGALLRQERAKGREEAAALCEATAAELAGLVGPGYARGMGAQAAYAEAANRVRALGPAPAPERCDRLAAEAARLRAALDAIAAWHDGDVGPHMDEPCAAERARAALLGDAPA